MLSKIVVRRIDNIIREINEYKNNPLFSRELRNRKDRLPQKIQTDNDLLKTFTTIICYSGQAPSSKVTELLESGLLKNIFNNFSVKKVSAMNPCEIVDRYWSKLGAIRYQTKIFQIVMFARRLSLHPEIMSIFADSKLPVRLKKAEDIDYFWIELKKMQMQLKQKKVSYFQETTTLLHYLLHSGYDCAKPDLVVLRSMRKIGLLTSEKNKKDLKSAIIAIQQYGILKRIRPSIVDFYLLIYGGQTDARKFVKPEYYHSS